MSEWTIDTLKEHHDAMIESLKKELEEGFAQRDKAVDKLEDSTSERFAARNEIQTAMKNAAEASERAAASLTSTFMPREEALAAIRRNEADIKAVTDRVNLSSGRGVGIKDSWGWVVGILGLLFALLLVLHH